MKLKPWREIITPHDTVLQGTFLPSTFAADLSKVVATLKIWGQTRL